MGKALSKFLMPNKRKIVLAFLLPYLWLGIRLAWENLTDGLLILPTIGKGFLPIVIYIVFRLVDSVLFYPFACSTIQIFDYRKSGVVGALGKDMKMAGLIFLGFLIFNPISLVIIVTSPFLLGTMLNPPQTGVVVLDVIQGSPASGRGEWLNGKAISQIDGEIIGNVEELTQLLNKYEVGEWIRIQTTDGSSGSIIIRFDETSGKIYLGLKVRDANGTEAIL